MSVIIDNSPVHVSNHWQLACPLQSSLTTRLSTSVIIDNSPVHFILHWQPACPLQYSRTTDSFPRNYQVLIQSRNSPHFMEPECSSPHSQVPATPSLSSMPSQFTSLFYLLLSSLYARSFQVCLFALRLPAKTVYALLLSPIRATFPAHFILLDLISQKLLGEQYRSISSSLCIFLHSPVPSYIYKNVKWSRYRPDVAQRVGRGIALLFHDRGTRRWWAVSSTPRPHFTPGKVPVPIVQEAGWAPEPVCRDAENLAPNGIRSPDSAARSQSLYLLSYLVPSHRVRGF